MIWNNIPNEERLHLWKTLREDIKDLPVNDQVAHLATFCRSIPYGTRTIDYYSPLEWPDPWEILFHGLFCTSSISVLMYYTLILLPNKKKVELLLVEDGDGIYLLPIIDDHFVLNYELGQVSKYSEIQNDIKVLQRYQEQEIKKIA
jgi:hypothetical protein